MAVQIMEGFESEASPEQVTTTSEITPSETSQRVRKKLLLPNEHLWRPLSRILDPYLDLESVLMLRQTCGFHYKRKVHFNNGVVDFTPFRGFDSTKMVDKALPIILPILTTMDRRRLSMDFSKHGTFNDSTIKVLMKRIKEFEEESGKTVNIQELKLNFCHHLTDRGLRILMEEYLPEFKRFSIASTRNKNMSGDFIVHDLLKNWPKIHYFNCDFSSIKYISVVRICEHMISIYNQDSTNKVYPYVGLVGSWASKRLLDELGFKELTQNFINAIKYGDSESASIITKTLRQRLLNVGRIDNPIYQILIGNSPNIGSELLANIPVNATMGESGDVWTLPLCHAIEKEDQDMFNLLLKRGARVDSWDFHGRSPLMRACEKGRDDMVEVLLEQGATALPYDLAGTSCIDIAIQRKDIKILQLLLSHGAALSYRSQLKSYRSPLYVASESQAPEIISMLLVAGADPTWRGANKITPTLLAFQKHPTLLPIFLRCDAANSKEKLWVLTEVMSCAVMEGNYHAVVLLAENNEKLLHRSHPIWSLPHIQAARLNQVQILGALLQLGAEVNAKGKDGSTALHVAAAEGNSQVIEMLLNQSAKINDFNSAGQTALHLACLENRRGVVDALIQHGALLNIPDTEEGETPLMICIRSRNEVVALQLLKNSSVDVDVKDRQGRTALMYAIIFGVDKICDKLADRGANMSSADNTGNTAYSMLCERLDAKGDKRQLKKYIKRYKEQNSDKSPTECEASELNCTIPDIAALDIDASAWNCRSNINIESSDMSPLSSSSGIKDWLSRLRGKLNR